MADDCALVPGIDRDRAIVDHIPLVRAVASGIARRYAHGVDIEELVSAGIVGLIEAVDRFRPERGVPFLLYAKLRIRGAIVDTLRSGDWVPRATRRARQELTAARTSLSRKLGREPTRLEMADAMGIDGQQYDELCASAAVRRVVALDAPLHQGDDGTVADRVASDGPTVDDRWIQHQENEGVASAMRKLPASEREVIHLYYERGLKMREIAEILGVCDSRVCQLRAAAVTRLHKLVATGRIAQRSSPTA